MKIAEIPTSQLREILALRERLDQLQAGLNGAPEEVSQDEATATPRKKRVFTDKQRKAIAKAQKARWARWKKERAQKSAA